MFSLKLHIHYTIYPLNFIICKTKSALKINYFKNYITLFFLLFLTANSFAQKDNKSQKALTEKERCGTMHHLNELMQLNNDLKLRYNQSLKDAEQRNSKPENNSTSITSRTTAIITIPVVFHIVLNNPFLVTDADIQAQIDRLNLDFSGKNADSTNASLFYTLRGHSEIRFCLAKRDPLGRLTNGIERKSSTTKYTVQTSDPIKIAALGGLDAWNSSNYLNIWIGEGDGLGYSTFPGTTSAAQDGIVLNLTGTSTNPCYVDASFNLGRTATHEVGHYLGLYHIWGDDPLGCTTDDFRQLPGACSVPSSLLIGDTPNQNNSTFGCPSGLRTDACSETSPGIQYQNFMDYTNDRCMTLFTKAQVSRMEWVLINCRPGLLTSPSCNIPPAAINLDATIASIINPGGSEIVGCNVILQPSLTCAGLFTPKLLIQNKGLITLTSIKVGLQINSNSPVIQTFSVTLPSGGFTSVTLSQQLLTIGNNSLRFFTSEPNGGVDENPSNDSLIKIFSIAGTAQTPIIEGFETGNFPPIGWVVTNPDNNITWQKSSYGYNSSNSAFINTYNYTNYGQEDQLLTPIVSYTEADSVLLSFNLSAAVYSDPRTTNIPLDTLEVLVTKDCGTTFTSVYKKWGVALQTINDPVNGQIDEFFPTNSSQWRLEKIDLTAFASSSPIQVAFRVINNYENNIFIDNVNLKTVVLPARLKKNGYLILPSPFRDNFAVWFRTIPANLSFINVYNAIGQLVWSKQFNNNASSLINIDITGKQSGIYFVHFGYSNLKTTVVERIVKH